MSQVLFPGEMAHLDCELWLSCDREAGDSIPNSSMERPPWKVVTAGPYTPGNPDGCSVSYCQTEASSYRYQRHQNLRW
jgi:hypothetical protein